ncbi:agamous-like MADS-box protein MADS9 [Vitis vinifera]|uniref:agamous-like MADS-box protein MADS9 n=1 Tax=Vitis vinifera TaxID=29760 RepID=UPI0000DE1CEB|nr:agamous-like MADS-box protein MADS9 [Vitis vinifera]AAY79173.1 putative PISTILLATA-like MADS-box protein [Vitis vinifera]ABK59993.1 B-class MADS-box transcription factor PISTILLATA [Vitis vinifera]AFR53062.1 PISTILLATA [Vitis vinifera]AFR53063.1 PISTILLATA [Vitis vinifera]|eukprot:NP_001267875.1 PISTILLATA-like MADS-box protein-like [Vitis vinifera]
MGRGKIEIKRIENSSNRQVTYSKRRNGIMKKAKEITVLCDAHVSLVIFASSGKMHEYCSPSTTLIDILDRYHKQSGKRLWDAKHENLSNELDRIKKENDSMQIELRHLKGEDISSLHHKELMAIEDALEIGLASVRNKQMEFYKMVKKNQRILEEENKHLNYIVHHQGMPMEAGNVREVESGYHQRAVRDYNPQMPFAFRVQPIQPNLQERI